MLNLSRMNLYRLLKSKSFYLTVGILGLFMLLTVIILTYDVPNTKSESFLEEEKESTIHYKSAQEMQKEEDVVNVGISFSSSSVAEEPTLINLNLEMIGSGFILLFTGIFAAIFVSAESSSGFLKNIAGCVKRRSLLIWGQLLSLAVFVLAEFLAVEFIFTTAGFLLIQDFALGSIQELLLFLAVQYLLHLAFAVLIMFIFQLLQSKTFSIVAACCLSSGIGTLIISYIGVLLGKLGVSNFTLSKYLISSNVQTYSNSSANSTILRAVLISFGAIILYNILSGIILSKRDIR